MTENKSGRNLTQGKIIFGAAVITLLLCLTFLSGFLQSEEEIRIGYCPTMQSVAEEFDSEQVEPVGKSSSSEALNSLRKGEVDAVVIGRAAKNNEISDADEKFLEEEGYTLVTDKKTFVQRQELENMTIHTYLPERKANELLPGSDIVYHENKDEAIDEGPEDAVLIKWQDYKDEELLVVMNGREKDEAFRTPVLYSEPEIDTTEEKTLANSNDT